jgi:protein phosphatase 1G
MGTEVFSTNHSGTEVSKFVEAHFIEELSKNKAFNEGNVEVALEQTFHRMDEMLQAPEANA